MMRLNAIALWLSLGYSTCFLVEECRTVAHTVEKSFVWPVTAQGESPGDRRLIKPTLIKARLEPHEINLL